MGSYPLRTTPVGRDAHVALAATRRSAGTDRGEPGHTPSGSTPAGITAAKMGALCTHGMQTHPAARRDQPELAAPRGGGPIVQAIRCNPRRFLGFEDGRVTGVVRK